MEFGPFALAATGAALVAALGLPANAGGGGAWRPTVSFAGASVVSVDELKEITGGDVIKTTVGAAMSSFYLDPTCASADACGVHSSAGNTIRTAGSVTVGSFTNKTEVSATNLFVSRFETGFIVIAPRTASTSSR